MMNVVSSEFYKILRSKIFYVISIILLAMNVIGAIATIYQKYSDSISPDVQAQMSGITGYQGSYDGEIIFYIILIFVACLITAEYANGSIRQMACHGIARWRLVIGQYIAISSAITMIIFIFSILNLLLGTILFQLGEVDMVAFIRMNVGLLCMIWGMTGIGTLFSYLFKNGGITIAISILLIICGNFIVYYLDLIIGGNVFTRYSLSNMRRTIIDLTSRPEEVVKCAVVFFVIGMVTVLGSSLLFSKRDVD